MIQVMYNNAAGDYLTNSYSEDDIENWEKSGYRLQSGHYHQVALLNNEEELEQFLLEFAGPTVWCVFVNRAAGEVMVTSENRLSGNWRGSKYGFFPLVREFTNEEEAHNYARNYY